MSNSASQTETSAPLPEPIQCALEQLVESGRSICGNQLVSMILFGSAAEGRLRATSDVNVMFVLTHFDTDRIDRLREPLRVANAAARVAAMFILESELPAAVEAFAVKFDDLIRRHRILYGKDIVAGLNVSRTAKRQRLEQMLLNLTLRLRERYLLVSLREEQLVAVIAEAAGPLRTAAASLLELEGKPVLPPKEALERLARESELPDADVVMQNLSVARVQRTLPAGIAQPTLLGLLELTARLRKRLERAA